MQLLIAIFQVILEEAVFIRENEASIQREATKSRNEKTKGGLDEII